MGIKICPKCNGKVSDSRNVCIHCGYVYPSSKICPDCGEAVDINVHECPVCGYLFNKIKTVESTSNDSEHIEINTSNQQQENDTEDTQIIETSENEQVSIIDEKSLTTDDVATPDKSDGIKIVKNTNEVNEIVVSNLGNDLIEIADSVEDSINEKVECPYCHEHNLMSIGIDYYMCATCKGKFLNIEAETNSTFETILDNNATIANVSPIVESISQNVIIPNENISQLEKKEDAISSLNTNTVDILTNGDINQQSRNISNDNEIEQSSITASNQPQIQPSIDKDHKKKAWIIIPIIAVLVVVLGIIIISNTNKEYTRKGNKIYFGSYPQTKVTDSSLISKLNLRAGTKPTSNNLYNWKEYKYYISSRATNFMFYQDIDYDNNGTYDYRGVYFTQYRPYYYYNSSSESYSYQDDNGYLTNTIYWFSYDQIEWDILTRSDGKALIIANLILDSQDYYPSASLSAFIHNGDTGYANNYALSSIRKFLNDDFYNTAFHDLQKDIINTSFVNNSARSTGHSLNLYACNNTFDKIFLLSYTETTYNMSTTSKLAKGSDYAKCQGLYVYNSTSASFWWLRSPYRNDANSACGVDRGGSISYSAVGVTRCGVRPACWITL